MNDLAVKCLVERSMFFEDSSILKYVVCACKDRPFVWNSAEQIAVLLSLNGS